MNVKDLRKRTGLSQQKFGDLYEIPLRTVQNWEGGVSVPPDYLVKLLARAVREDFPDKAE